MSNPLARKLQAYTRLSDVDTTRLAASLSPGRPIAPRVDIIQQDDDPRAVNVILDGWACRYRVLDDGRRQIIAILLPGDPCDPHIFLLRRMDHAIAALTPVTLAQIPGAALDQVVAECPALDYAFHREMLATAAVQREWTVSLGRRSAIERLAHLFCELMARLDMVGLADDASCPMPLTQPDLADALGQTSVHINRTLQELRAMGLVSVRNRRLTVHNRKDLVRLAQFDPTYLHFTPEAELPSNGAV